MKKTIYAVVLSALLCVLFAVSCTKNAVMNDKAQKNETLRVVCTIFPVYDWAKNIVGLTGTAAETPNVKLELLIKNGVDPHSFRPSAADIVAVSSCDVLIYCGGESERWVDDVLKTAVNKNMITINLLDVLGHDAKYEEIIEGMESDHEAHDDHDAHGENALHDEHETHGNEREHAAHESHTENVHESYAGGALTVASYNEAAHDETAVHGEPQNAAPHDESKTADTDSRAAVPSKESAPNHVHSHGERDYDEHVWLSLKNARTFCNAIAAALSRADSNNAETYAANARNYAAALEELDSRYAHTVKIAARDTIIVADRFPLRYLVDDYGIDYFAAFPGCSSESEASFETIVFLAHKIDTLGITSVLTIEGARGKIAQTVIDNTKNKNMRVLVFDSLQSVSQKDEASGVTYLSVMQKNLDVLNAALN